MRKVDFSGSKIGYIDVISIHGVVNGTKRYNCICQCGKIMTISHSNLKSGQKSCGCHLKDYFKSKEFSNLNKTHGYSKHELYQTWVSMIKRCYNPKAIDYPRYGGRGIKVCDRWNNGSPENFIKDIEEHLGKRPHGHTLDRIDNDKGYFLDNVKWSTKSEQGINRRSLNNSLQEKYIFKRRGLFIVSIVRNGQRMLSNGQKTLEDAKKLRDFYLKTYNETPEKWNEICSNKKYKNIGGFY